MAGALHISRQCSMSNTWNPPQPPASSLCWLAGWLAQTNLRYGHDCKAPQAVCVCPTPQLPCNTSTPEKAGTHAQLGAHKLSAAASSNAAVLVQCMHTSALRTGTQPAHMCTHTRTHARDTSSQPKLCCPLCSGWLTNKHTKTPKHSVNETASLSVRPSC